MPGAAKVQSEPLIYNRRIICLASPREPVIKLITGMYQDLIEHLADVISVSHVVSSPCCQYTGKTIDVVFCPSRDNRLGMDRHHRLKMRQRQAEIL